MPSKSYIAPETAIVWADSGGDELLDLGGLVASGVACGAFADLGSASRADQYEVNVLIDGFDTPPVVGEVLDVYMAQSSDTTNWDGQPTTAPTTSAEGTYTSAQVDNCLYVGSLVVYSTTAADELQARFVTRLTSRYCAPIIVNRTADALLSTADAHTVTLTPIPQEAQ